MRTSKTLIALGVAGALSFAAAVPSLAAPVMTSTATLKQAATDHVIDVRWRGRGFGPAGIIAGFAAGALITSEVAGRPYGPDYYYDSPAYADGPVYAQPYGDAPTYVAPGYYQGYGRRCFTDEGYGRRRPCDAN